MNAIEFTSQTHDGVIDLPQEFADWNGKKVRVILLEEDAKDRREPTPGVHDEIEVLLRSPLRVSDATPLAREEVYER